MRLLRQLRYNSPAGLLVYIIVALSCILMGLVAVQHLVLEQSRRTMRLTKCAIALEQDDRNRTEQIVADYQHGTSIFYTTMVPTTEVNPMLVAKCRAYIVGVEAP